MWSERIKNNIVIIEGVSLRSKPKYDINNKDKYRIAKIRVGAKIKVIKTQIDFYKIKGLVPTEWKEGWVWYKCGKVIK